jgi:hypothetical protein
MVPLLDSHEVVYVLRLAALITEIKRFFIRNRDKVRIIALYIQHRDGVPDEDRRRLYQHARLSLAEQDAVNSLVHLGVRISRVRCVPSIFIDGYVIYWSGVHITQGPNDRDTKKRIKPRSSEDEYVLSRYNPLLKTVLEVSRPQTPQASFQILHDNNWHIFYISLCSIISSGSRQRQARRYRISLCERCSRTSLSRDESAFEYAGFCWHTDRVFTEPEAHMA